MKQRREGDAIHAMSAQNSWAPPLLTNAETQGCHVDATSSRERWGHHMALVAPFWKKKKISSWWLNMTSVTPLHDGGTPHDSPSCPAVPRRVQPNSRAATALHIAPDFAPDSASVSTSSIEEPKIKGETTQENTKRSEAKSGWNEATEGMK